MKEAPWCWGGRPRCAPLHATLPREGVLSARPRTAVILHMTFLLKLSETLKEVYCNVNNLSLLASVFLLQWGRSRGVRSGLCLRPARPGWAQWAGHSCPLPKGRA